MTEARLPAPLPKTSPASGGVMAWVVGGVFAVLVAAALAVFAFAAAAIALIVGLAALVLRFAPQGKSAGAPQGWVVGAGLRR